MNTNKAYLRPRFIVKYSPEFMPIQKKSLANIDARHPYHLVMDYTDIIVTTDRSD